MSDYNDPFTKYSSIDAFAWHFSILDRILKEAPTHLKIRTQLHTTGGQGLPTTSLHKIPSDEKEDNEVKQEMPGMEKGSTLTENIPMMVVPGRPHIKTLLEEELSSVQNDLSVNGTLIGNTFS